MNSKYSLTFLAATMAMIISSFPVQATEIDDKIEASAKSSYVFKTYLDEVEVDSEKGVVTLSGNVGDTAYVALAEDTVSSLPGVVRVDNRLTVKGVEAEENSDAWLVTKVKTTLLFHRNVSAMTSVTANNGVITLGGVADNEAEKELTTEYASDINGVTKVNNEMSVSAVSKEKSTTFGEKIDDASITAQVKMVLLSHHSTTALHTSVKTTDGVVTVSGEAQNDAEVALVTKIAGDTKGVEKVNNMMTVVKKS